MIFTSIHRKQYFITIFKLYVIVCNDYVRKTLPHEMMTRAIHGKGLIGTLHDARILIITKLATAGVVQSRHFNLLIPVV